VEGREVSPQKSVTTTVPTRNSWSHAWPLLHHLTFSTDPHRTVISLNDRCNLKVMHCNLWSIAPPTNHRLGEVSHSGTTLCSHERSFVDIEGQAACYHVGRTATVVVNSLGHTRRRAISADAGTLNWLTTIETETRPSLVPPQAGWAAPHCTPFVTPYNLLYLRTRWRLGRRKTSSGRMSASPLPRYTLRSP
jgi:hypothetical protein